MVSGVWGLVAERRSTYRAYLALVGLIEDALARHDGVPLAAVRPVDVVLEEDPPTGVLARDSRLELRQRLRRLPSIEHGLAVEERVEDAALLAVWMSVSAVRRGARPCCVPGCWFLRKRRNMFAMFLLRLSFASRTCMPRRSIGMP